MTRAGARTGLQILGLGDKQRFNSSSAARGFLLLRWLPVVFRFRWLPVFVCFWTIYCFSCFRGGLPVFRRFLSLSVFFCFWEFSIFHDVSCLFSFSSASRFLFTCGNLIILL